MKYLILLIALACSTIAAPEISQIPTVKIAWNFSADEPDITGYRVHFGKESGVYTEVIDVGIGVRHISNQDVDSVRPQDPLVLPSQGLWYCAVTAYNSYGLESPYSNEISFTRQAPGAPDGVRLEVVIQTSSNMKDWEPIASTIYEGGSEQMFRLAFTEQPKK